jgi:2,3-bisphosphoglycerate-independent phosphoglycerate mutase
MKFVIVIPDGAADMPIAELGAKTPFEVAHMPRTHELARGGRVGIAHTTPGGFEAGSDVCSMSLLGYDPATYHTGRAPLEAAAQGIALMPSDWILRLNFVTTGLEGADAGKMLDHSAGAISDAEARTLLQDLVVFWQERVPEACQGVFVHPGVSYRNILIDRSGKSYAKVATTPPHAVPGDIWEQHLPRGDAASSAKLVALMRASLQFLPGHAINRARKNAGKRMATMAWIWGQGTKPSMPSFALRFGLRGAMITSVDLLRGIAASIGWDRVEVAGLTSYHNTDYAAQGRATIGALEQYDIVCCHVEAPDEASHQGDWKTKVASLEAIDAQIVTPLSAAMQARWSDTGWRMLYMPDHYTLCGTRKHDATPVPFFIAGTHMRSAVPRAMTESDANASDLRVEHGHELMEYFLQGNRAHVR